MPKIKKKKVIKKESKVAKEKDRRLVADRNVERMLKDGWKIVDVEKIKDGHGRLLGVKTNASDLTLMEK